MFTLLIRIWSAKQVFEVQSRSELISLAGNKIFCPQSKYPLHEPTWNGYIWSIGCTPRFTASVPCRLFPKLVLRTKDGMSQDGWNFISSEMACVYSTGGDRAARFFLKQDTDMSPGFGATFPVCLEHPLGLNELREVVGKIHWIPHIPELANYFQCQDLELQEKTGKCAEGIFFSSSAFLAMNWLVWEISCLIES